MWAHPILITGPTLRPTAAARLLPVCCLDPAVRRRSEVARDDAIRDPGAVGSGWQAGPIRRRWPSIDPGEAGGERADALKSDQHADVGHGPVGVAQERRGALQPARLEIGP